MKKTFTLLLLFIVSSSYAQNPILSQFNEGSSSNKRIELNNPNTSSIDFSAYYFAMLLPLMSTSDLKFNKLQLVRYENPESNLPGNSICNQNENTGFSLYPSQVENRMKVRFEAPVKNGRLQVYNSAGQIVINIQIADGIDVLNMNVADLQSGQYIVHLIHAEGTFKEKFIKI